MAPNRGETPEQLFHEHCHHPLDRLMRLRRGTFYRNFNSQALDMDLSGAVGVQRSLPDMEREWSRWLERQGFTGKELQTVKAEPCQCQQRGHHQSSSHRGSDQPSHQQQYYQQPNDDPKEPGYQTPQKQLQQSEDLYEGESGPSQPWQQNDFQQGGSQPPQYFQQSQCLQQQPYYPQPQYPQSYTDYLQPQYSYPQQFSQQAQHLEQPQYPQQYQYPQQQHYAQQQQPYQQTPVAGFLLDRQRGYSASASASPLHHAKPKSPSSTRGKEKDTRRK